MRRAKGRPLGSWVSRCLFASYASVAVSRCLRDGLVGCLGVCETPWPLVCVPAWLSACWRAPRGRPMGGWMQKAIVEEWETHREGQTHSGHDIPTQHPHSHPTPSSLSLCGRQRRPFPARRTSVCAPTRSHARTHPVPWLLPAALFCVCRHRQREWPRCRCRALVRTEFRASNNPPTPRPLSVEGPSGDARLSEGLSTRGTGRRGTGTRQRGRAAAAGAEGRRQLDVEGEDGVAEEEQEALVCLRDGDMGEGDAGACCCVCVGASVNFPLLCLSCSARRAHACRRHGSWPGVCFGVQAC